MLHEIVDILNDRGVRGLADCGFRKLRGGRMRDFEHIRAAVDGKAGLEIGGPSKGVFGKLMPIYDYAGSIDNCNFAVDTIWESSIKEGETFTFNDRRRPGRQYVCDASDLSHLPNDAYDFVMSSHVIEHIANPIRALQDWRRVLKPGGAAIFVVPHRAHTFDRRRPLTTLEHMIDDFEKSTGDDDQTHLQETLDLIDYSMIPWGRDELAALGRDVLKTRALHHHTFDEVNFAGLVAAAGFDVRRVQFEWPHQLIAVGTKGSGASNRRGGAESQAQ